MPPSVEDYCKKGALSKTFENTVLYKMCRDDPDHKSSYVTSGKILSIGRIYAASPERGSGKKTPLGPTLTEAIGIELLDARFDKLLAKIDFDDRASDDGIFDVVVDAHEFLMLAIQAATRKWSPHRDEDGWKPKHFPSFASKYLHFHRPNAFPIMDSFAKIGLGCAGQRRYFKDYRTFCASFIQYAETQNKDWTPRGIDTILVERGRIHEEAMKDGTCSKCENRKKPKT
jgi:hypothetical protein